MLTIVVTRTDTGQQGIITGDPDATEKWIESKKDYLKSALLKR